jgi:hypothetical protein
MGFTLCLLQIAGMRVTPPLRADRSSAVDAQVPQYK